MTSAGAGDELAHRAQGRPEPGAVSASADRDAGPIHGIMLACVPAMFVCATCVMLPIQAAMAGAFRSLPNAAGLVSLAVVLPTLTVAAASLAAGLAGERFGRRRLLVIATGVFAVCAVAPALLTGMSAILASRGLAGLALGAMITSAVGLTGDYYSGAALQRWLAAQGAGGAVAGVATSLAAGALAEVSWRYAFGLLLVGAVLFLALAAVRPPQASASSGRPADSVGETGAGAAAQAGVWSSWAAIAALAVLGTLAIFPPAYELAYLLQEKRLGGSFLTGAATAVLAAGAILGATGLGRLRRLGAQAKIAAALAFAASGTLLVAVADRIPMLLAGAALDGVAQGMLGPVLSVWLIERTPERLRGRAVGLLQTLSFLALFAAPLIARRLAVLQLSSAAAMRDCLVADAALFLALTPFLRRSARA